MKRTIDLEVAPKLNQTHVNIIKLLEESEADNYREGVPGMSIKELADELELKGNTVTERVSELEEFNLVKKKKSEFNERSVIIRPSDHYDAELGNRKIYMKENGIDY